MTLTNNNKRMVWNFFYKKDTGLLDIAIDRHSEEDKNSVALIIAVMESGMLDLDLEYINNGGLQNHCYVLGLSYKHVLYAFNKMRSIIENKTEWRE